MTSTTNTIGVYGKVASQPDFLRANAGEFSQGGLDHWFQEGVEALRGGGAVLPDAPTGFVLKAPASKDVFAGAFAPSADAAGRSFPLAVFHRLGGGDWGGSFPQLLATQDSFVRAAASVASAGRELAGPDLVARAESLSSLTHDGGTSGGPLAQGSAQALFEALGGTPSAVAYALRTFATACDQAAKMAGAGPVEAAATITVDAPAPTLQVRQLWLEIARRRLHWRELTPSFLWTEGPSGRLLIALGQVPPAALSYLANPRHRASRFWPLRTEVPAALEQALKALTVDQRRDVETPATALSGIIASFAS